MSQPEEDCPIVGLVLPPETRNPPTLSLGSGGEDTQNRDRNVNNSKLVEDSMNEARFWKVYQDEANVQDKEFVADRKQNLDTMLVFAGLYSAILTAFIIDSTKHLQQDPANVTNALLFNIAQSQWRMETGNANSSIPQVELPSFEVPTDARFVNCMWYAALMLSLTAAMMAIFAKEWLAAYVTYETRHPRLFTRQRQDRYMAFESWFGIIAIDFVPMLLYISLFLFTLGLLQQMSSIDAMVATTILLMGLVTEILVLLTIVLGADFDFCPYQARMSLYLRRLYKWSYDKGQAIGASVATDGGTTKKRIHKSLKSIGGSGVFGATRTGIGGMLTPRRARDWDAIEWFLDNARDQNAVYAVYRWINGSRLPGAIGNIDPNETSRSSQNLTERDRSLILDLGKKSVEKLSTLREKQYYSLVHYEGANAAKHALVVSEACMHAQSYIEMQSPRTRGASMNRNTSKARNLIDSALRALDQFWRSEPPPMTIDSNAFLVAAELRVTTCALKSLLTLESPPRTSPVATTETPNQNDASISIPQASDAREDSQGLLSKLQLRADRGLYRSGLLLYYHLQRQAHMTPGAFSTLVSSLLELNMELERSTKGHTLPFTQLPLEVKIGNAGPTEYRFHQGSLVAPHGLLAGLVSLLDTSATTVTPLGSSSEEMKNGLIRLTFQLTSRLFRQLNPGSLPLGRLTDSVDKTPGTRNSSPTANTFIPPQLLDISYLALICANTRLPAELDQVVESQITHLGSSLLKTCIKTFVSQTDTPEGLQSIKDCLTMNRARKVSILKAWVDTTVEATVRDTIQNSSDTTTVETMTLRLLGCDDAVSCVLEKGTDERDEKVVIRLRTILKDISSSGKNSDCIEVLRQLHEHYCHNEDDVSICLLVKHEVFTHLVDIARQNTQHKGRVMYIASRVLLRTKQTSPLEGPESDFYPLRLYSEFCRSVEFLLSNLSSNWDIPEVPEHRPEEPEEPNLKHRVLKAIMKITGKIAPLVRGRNAHEGDEYPEEFKGMVSKLVDASKEINYPKVQRNAAGLLRRINDGVSILRQPSLGSLRLFELFEGSD